MPLVLEIIRAVQADDPFGFRVGPQDYLLRTPLGGTEVATLVWDEAFLAELAALRRPGRDPELLAKVGDRLRRFLATAGQQKREEEILLAVGRGEPVQLTLRLGAAELYSLPWELMTVGTGGLHLGELPGVLLRYAWPETASAPEEPEPRPEGGRVLFAYSAAAGAVPAREHLNAIERACRAGHHPFDPARDVLPNLSTERLAKALAEAAAEGAPPIAVLHILCHGAAKKTSFGLAWNVPIRQSLSDAAGAVQLVDAGQLRQLLAPHAGRIRLVVLAACDSANSGQIGSHLGSIAQALHRAGIAQVVASRYPLSVAGSIRLTEALYGSLLGGPDSLETALGTARQALRQQADSLDWASLQLFARPEDGEDSRPLVIRPYRGLSPFLSSHSRFFFGRERERRQARQVLDRLREAGQPRFLLVAGASGSGKSSLVLGGLIPDLSGIGAQAGAPRLVEARRMMAELSSLLGEHRGAPPLRAALSALQAAVAELPDGGGGPWEWAVLRPGDDPLGALERALRGRRDPGRPFLLCVDQLEELFTHAPAPDRAGQRCEFARRLWALSREPVSQGSGGVHCVLTLRVDFFGHLSELLLDDSGLRLDRVAYSEAHSLFVAQLEPVQLAAAISGPARRVGLELPAALVQQMVRDVEGEPGALPLLEYVLDLLWQGRRGRALSEQSYAELGGVGGALGNSAEKLLLGLSPADQRLARRLLVRLVGFSESGGGETRRRVPLRRLAEQIPDPERHLDAVLEAFVEARLLVRSEEQGERTIEVAHEALVRKWPRLRAWLHEDRQRLEELRELEAWAAQHAAYGTVLRGLQLGYAQRLLDKYPGELGEAVTAMIRRSARAKRLLRGQLAAVLVVVLGALSGLTILARRNQGRALRERAVAVHKERVASSRLLGIRAERVLTQKPDLALLLAARSLSLHRELASRSVLAAALEHSRPIERFLRGPAGRIYSVAWSPDGRALAAASPEAVWLYDPRAGEVRGGLVFPSEGAARGSLGLHAVAFSPDGRLLAAAGSGGRVWLWDLNEPTRSAEVLPAAARTLYSLDFSRRGELLAAGTEDGRVLLWDFPSRQPRSPLHPASGQLVSALSFSPQPLGSAPRLAVGSGAGGVSVFDAATGSRLLGPLSTDKGYISGLAWSPDGRRLASTGEDRSVLLWDGETGAALGQPLGGHESAVSSVAWSPDGRLLASCGLDQAVYLWDAAAGQPLGEPLRAPGGSIYSCALSPDGRHLVSGSDGQLVLWGVAELPARRRLSPQIKVSALAVDPAGRQAVIGAPDGSIRRWELVRPEVGAAVPVHSQGINALAYDPSGARLASAGSDGAVRILQAETLAVQLRLDEPGHGSVMAVAWGPRGEVLAAGYTDGSLAFFESQKGARRGPIVSSRQQSITALAFLGDRLISSGLDGSLRLWRLDTLAPVCAVPSAHGDGVTALSVSPDGRSLATGGRDQRVVLWRPSPDGSCPVAAGELSQDGIAAGAGDGAEPAAVTALTFSPDGATVVAGSEDAAVRLWDVAARQPIGGPLRGHLRPLTALAFARDGLLLSADDEGPRRWDLLESRWPAVACERANRNLTLPEWQLFFPDSPYCRVCEGLPAGSGPATAPPCPDAVPAAPAGSKLD